MPAVDMLLRNDVTLYKALCVYAFCLQEKVSSIQHCTIFYHTVLTCIKKSDSL